MTIAIYPAHPNSNYLDSNSSIYQLCTNWRRTEQQAAAAAATARGPIRSPCGYHVRLPLRPGPIQYREPVRILPAAGSSRASGLRDATLLDPGNGYPDRVSGGFARFTILVIILCCYKKQSASRRTLKTLTFRCPSVRNMASFLQQSPTAMLPYFFLNFACESII